MDAPYEKVMLTAGTMLFSEGDAGTCAFLIISGCIEIFISHGGEETLLAIRGPGEIVGEIAIIDNRPRSASARIAADCEMILVTAKQIASRIAETDPILRLCLGVVIERYRETVARLQGSGIQPVYIETGTMDNFTAVLESLSYERELRDAIRNGEFELFFQPIVRLPSRRLAGFEALIRWRHPVRGLVPPGEFIPIAETNGLIGDITTWCLAEAGRKFPALIHAALWNVEAVDPLFIAVNISGHDLTRPSFLLDVAAMLAGSGIIPGSVKLEVTESVLMKDPAIAAKTLMACRDMGLGIAIDDFGTGYSSLSHLGALPITSIKIDQSFIRTMLREPTSLKIIHMILRLASELEIPVIAEGIEHEEEQELLAGLGCAFGQGYCFGKPQPHEAALATIRTWPVSGASAPAIRTSLSA